MNTHNSPDKYYDFGDKIKEIRTFHKMTRDQLSTALSIPPTTIRGIEQGNHTPSFKFIKAISTNPIFRQYLLWLLCSEWDEHDHNNENFPLDIKQTKPYTEKQRKIEELENQINELKKLYEVNTK